MPPNASKRYARHLRFTAIYEFVAVGALVVLLFILVIALPKFNTYFLLMAIDEGVPTLGRSMLILSGLVATVAIFALVVSKIYDLWRSVRGRRPKRVPKEYLDNVATVLGSSLDPEVLTLVKRRLRWSPWDLSSGAHVLGVVYPKIVVSGGLFVQLLRSDPSSIAVLSHEAAHISNFDKIIPGIFSIALLVCVYLLFQFTAFAWLFSVGLMYFCCWFCRRREFFADEMAGAYARGGDICGALGAIRPYASFFHPSKQDRMQRVTDRRSIGSFSWERFGACALVLLFALFGIYPLYRATHSLPNIIIGHFQESRDIDFYVLIAFLLFLGSIVGMLFELLWQRRFSVRKLDLGTA